MRVASLSPAATEILFAIGAGRQVVCVDHFSDFPEGARALPRLAGHQAIDLGALREHAPDLVLTGTVVQEKLAAKLKDAGFTVAHHDPRTLREIEEEIAAIALLLDRENAGRAAVEAFRRGFQEVRKRAKSLPRKARVYVEEWHDPPHVSGNWVPETLGAAGGIGLPLEPRSLSRPVAAEEIAAFDPDLIVLSWCGYGLRASKDAVRLRPGWERIRAVEQGRVRVIDDALLNRPGPRLHEGARRLFGWIAETAYG